MPIIYLKAVSLRERERELCLLRHEMPPGYHGGILMMETCIFLPLEVDLEGWVIMFVVGACMNLYDVHEPKKTSRWHAT